MTAFLNDFDIKREDALELNRSAEQQIVEILDRIRIQSKSNLGTAEGYEDLKGDLALKEKEVKNSEMTVEAILIGMISMITL